MLVLLSSIIWVCIIRYLSQCSFPAILLPQHPEYMDLQHIVHNNIKNDRGRKRFLMDHISPIYKLGFRKCFSHDPQLLHLLFDCSLEPIRLQLSKRGFDIISKPDHIINRFPRQNDAILLHSF